MTQYNDVVQKFIDDIPEEIEEALKRSKERKVKALLECDYLDFDLSWYPLGEDNDLTDEQARRLFGVLLVEPGPVHLLPRPGNPGWIAIYGNWETKLYQDQINKIFFGETEK